MKLGMLEKEKKTVHYLSTFIQLLGERCQANLGQVLKSKQCQSGPKQTKPVK